MRRRREAQKWRRVADDIRAHARKVEQVPSTLATDRDVVAPTTTRTGHVTLRCSICGKVCFRDQKSAEEAVAKIPDPMDAYFSERCGFWHLATRREAKT